MNACSQGCQSATLGWNSRTLSALRCSTSEVNRLKQKPVAVNAATGLIQQRPFSETHHVRLVQETRVGLLSSCQFSDQRKQWQIHGNDDRADGDAEETDQ